jgi:hypothetical protein
MQIAVANPARLVAVVGVAALLAGGMLVLKTTQGGGETASPEPVLLRTTAKGAKTPAKPKPVTSKPRPKPLPAVTASGLPRSVAVALTRNPVVVVAVTAPRGRVDSLLLEEARAGAALGRAGFTTVNAFRTVEMAALASKFGVRSNPAVIVVKRPGELSIRIDGFADRATVAQAATDARR